MEKSIPITRALISVFDKTGLVELASFLREQNVLIISTGGTARYLEAHNIPITDISTVGQFPEILDGRVKTLNSRIHAGILCDRSKVDHLNTLEEFDIPPIDLVITNLYPFSQVATSFPNDLEKLIENIDIGGPTMLRAAAKNHEHVAVLSSPNLYEEFIEHYRRYRGTLLSYRRQLALHVFKETHRYDAFIEKTLSQSFGANKQPDMPFSFAYERSLRYGENPHQEAALYQDISAPKEQINLSTIHSTEGKELSYNNLLDAHCALWALRCLMDKTPPSTTGAIVVKHGIPCGAAHDLSQTIALKKALASDEKSAFGGVIALGTMCDRETAEIIAGGFFEVIIAASFNEEAQQVLQKKAQLRLISIPQILSASLPSHSIRSIFGAALIQHHDSSELEKDRWSFVTNRQPSKEDLAALEFAYRMVIPTPSNAITLATADQLIGVGAGQPNRIQSAMLAIQGAKERGFSLNHAALASDAFFPFDDSVKYAAQNGIRLIIQPGGSIRDREVIQTANDLGICMVFTHRRHFKH